MGLGGKVASLRFLACPLLQLSLLRRLHWFWPDCQRAEANVISDSSSVPSLQLHLGNVLRERQICMDTKIFNS